MTTKRPFPEVHDRLPNSEFGAALDADAAFATSLHTHHIDWYVAAAVPRKERFAIANLQNQGFTTFFPLLHKQSGRHPAKSVSPLFPGYIFVGLNPQRIRWQSINGTFGVRYLVGPRGALPHAVPSTIMDELFHRFPQGVMPTPDCRFQRGDRVDVISGSFAGIPAKFEEMLTQNRIKVLLDWLSTEVSAVMPASCIGAPA